MLSDFVEVKANLSIVNKSFVSLGKPLRYDHSHSFVYFRDTILLAPAGVGSLDKLGDLYKGEWDITKKKISSHDITNMSQNLLRDKARFEEYALQFAFITLKHAISMDKFNPTLIKIGVPLTLSSLGSFYVFK